MLIYDRPGQLKAEEVKGDFERTLQAIHRYLQNVDADCRTFNSQLEPQIRQILSERKNRILQIRQALRLPRKIVLDILAATPYFFADANRVVDSTDPGPA